MTNQTHDKWPLCNCPDGTCQPPPPPATRCRAGRVESVREVLKEFARTDSLGLPPSPRGAHPLYPVLMEAIDQATGGKGMRHGGDTTPFLEQPWRALAQRYGVGGLLFQAAKKMGEAMSKDSDEAFRRELLGAVVYAGMALIFTKSHPHVVTVAPARGSAARIAAMDRAGEIVERPKSAKDPLGPDLY